MIGFAVVVAAIWVTGIVWAAIEHGVEVLKARRQRRKTCACGHIVLRGREEVISLTAVHDQYRCQPLWEVV